MLAAVLAASSRTTSRSAMKTWAVIPAMMTNR
jgi:hypothetical protein